MGQYIEGYLGFDFLLRLISDRVVICTVEVLPERGRTSSGRRGLNTCPVCPYHYGLLRGAHGSAGEEAIAAGDRGWPWDWDRTILPNWTKAPLQL